VQNMTLPSPASPLDAKDISPSAVTVWQAVYVIWSCVSK